MSTQASTSTGEGWALTWVPHHIARNAKNGKWALTRALALTWENTVCEQLSSTWRIVTSAVARNKSGAIKLGLFGSAGLPSTTSLNP